MNKHLIIGAGKFSHAHLRVLNELGVTQVDILKNSTWQVEQTSAFKTKHPNLHLSFFSREDDNITSEFYKDKIVHIVTPSNTHLNILKEVYTAQRIFLEKPSVLYDSESSFKLAKYIFDNAYTIYHNDWFANIQELRTDKSCPTNISFSYDVVNNDVDNLITEIASHCLILLTNWFEPNSNISIQKLNILSDLAEIVVTIDYNTTVNISVTAGRVTASSWQCSINNEQFDSATIRGTLLINTLNTMLTNTKPFTNWYKASWMIHRFRMLQEPDLFNWQFNEYY
jgi:predicted dehydrogenase